MSRHLPAKTVMALDDNPSRVGTVAPQSTEQPHNELTKGAAHLPGGSCAVDRLPTSLHDTHRSPIRLPPPVLDHGIATHAAMLAGRWPDGDGQWTDDAPAGTCSAARRRA